MGGYPHTGVPTAIDSAENYSGLNRELEISVYRHDQPQIFTRQPMRQSQVLTQPTSDPPPSETQVMWSQQPKDYHKYKKHTNSYYFQTPFQKYLDLVAEFGPPTLVNPQPGGMAIWQNPNGIFKRIVLVDEQIVNRFPQPHLGFLYTDVKIKIPIENLNKVLSISGDLMYDNIKKILTVRGMSINYNLALIALVCRYVTGHISWYQIIDGDYIRESVKYKKLIHPKHQQQNLKIISDYLKHKHR
jgi:hypothetical protein